MSGALLRTNGAWNLKLREQLELDLVLSEDERAVVKAMVVRNQRPDWKRGLVGGVGVAFQYQGADDLNKAIVERYVAAGPSPATAQN